MTLAELNSNDSAVIMKIRGKGAFRRRLMEMGLLTGEKITVIRKAPLNDPIEYEIKGYKIILRYADAKFIEVNKTPSESEKRTSLDTLIINNDNIIQPGRNINIGLIGNCTSGKTTIFNYFTGLNERVGNYAGVTLDQKNHQFKYKDYLVNLFDLPGIYSLSGNQPQKKIVRDFLFDIMPDIIINVVDATNLERNLLLTTDLIDSDNKVIIALNMYDEFVKSGNNINIQLFETITGVPFVPVSAKKNKNLDELLNRAIEVYEDKYRSQRHVHINYGDQLEKSIKNIQACLKIEDNLLLTNKISSRFLSINLLRNDQATENLVKQCINSDDIITTVKKEKEQVDKLYKVSSEQLITDYKFGFINGALKETFQPAKIKRKKSETIDNILTHKYFGLPIFFFFMWLMFTATFKIGSYPMHWIDELVNYLSHLVASNMNDGTLKDLIIDGVFSGVGGVLVFLPNILILYFFISLMEDTGYMSRTVFIMDKIMHRIGLHGKSFIPLVMGFGCNVPAILSSRMLENKKERLITILINPFISCNARLPVYILFISAFFPENSGSVLFIIYFTGIIVAVITALILKRFLVKAHEYPFVMELPPYRVPSGKVIVRNMWEKSSQYLRKIGGVILISSIIFWALSYFPTEQNSFLMMIGRFIEPAMRPLGFNWKVSVALLSGVAAKEIVVSTLGVLNAVMDLTPAIALSLMLFTLIYFPCIATIGAIKNETGSWKWALFTVCYTLVLAWIVAFVVYRVFLMFAA